MILKMRTQYILKAIAWRLIDGIKRIDYGLVDEPKYLKGKTGNPNYINTQPENSNKMIIHINIYYRDGSFDMFCTDDIVYIMDDNGKTCETMKPLFYKSKSPKSKISKLK